MKKSFLMFWLLLLFTLFNTYADSNYISYSNNNTQTKQATTSNRSNNNIGDFKNLSAYPYDLAATSLSWTKQGGASGGVTFGYGVSPDSSGNSYITGTTSIGLFGQIQNGYFDYFIVKYDKNGYITWSRQVGNKSGVTASTTQGNGIATDNNGNVYVVGQTNIGISGQTQNGVYDYFVAKYDVNGNIIWSKQVGASGGGTYGSGISADNLGNIYVTGSTNIGISGQKQNGIWDYFIAKYDMNGNLIWSKQVGTFGGYTYGQGITADNNGNIYVTGSTNVGISGQIQTGLGDYFIAKYDTLGNLIWTKQVGASGGGADGQGITTDNNGNIYVTGSTNVGISGQVQNGFNDYFIARYDINGNIIWSRQVGAYFGNTFGTGISTDSSGNIYITGWTTVGISGQKQNGRNDYFVAKYDQYGLAWTTQVGTAGGNTYGYGINTDILGNIYVAGSTDIGISGQIQNGLQNYFIAKYVN